MLASFIARSATSPAPASTTRKRLALARAIGDREYKAGNPTSLGIAQRLLVDPQKAIEYHEQALPVLEKLQEVRRSATLSNLARARYEVGEYEAALAADERALPLNRRAADRQGEAFTLSGLDSTADITMISWLAVRAGRDAVDRSRRRLI